MIGREVRDIQPQGFADVGLPLRLRLSGQPVNQVYAYIIYIGIPAKPHGADGLLATMPAVEEAQVFRIEALHPHAHPVERKTAKHPGEGVVHIVGIRLHRDFCVGRNGIEAVYGLEDSLKIFGGKLRRGASSEINRLDRLALQIGTT